MLSTAQGPAMIASSSPPILNPATSMTVGSGWNSRLTSLYFSVMRTAFSTPSRTLIFSSMLPMIFLSPITPTIVRVSPTER